jgi:hypothetical protein
LKGPFPGDGRLADAGISRCDTLSSRENALTSRGVSHSSEEGSRKNDGGAFSRAGAALVAMAARRAVEPEDERRERASAA